MSAWTTSDQCGRAASNRPPDFDARRSPVIWFEVEDLLRYYDHYPYPTGMQRVSLEIFGAVERLYGSAKRVRFCRLSLYTGRFEALSFDAVLARCTHGPGIDAPWGAVPLPRRPRDQSRTLLRALARVPRYLRALLGPVAHDLMGLRTTQPAFERLLAPGDIIVCLGGPWVNRRYTERLAALKRAHRVRFVQLVHDVIPFLNPAWIAHFGRAYRRWLSRIGTTADLILTVSPSAREDLLAVAAAHGFALPRTEVIRLGTDFQRREPVHSGTPSIAGRVPRRYVLCVSTIETRKNHVFLLRVWKRLVERHGALAIPDLVLVGRVGYLLVDTLRFRAELAAGDYVQGKVVVLSDLSDADLREVYRGCLFTVYPSLYEGWGLPVAESLAHGKFCVASNRAAIPEAGGDFIDYFDPTDEHDALVTLERVLCDPHYLAAREARVRAEYRPPTWSECAQDFIAKIEGLGLPPAAANAAPMR